VCKQFTKLTGVEDRGCRRTSRALNQLSKRLIVNGIKVIDRVRGTKKGYWEVDTELLNYVLLNATVRRDSRGRVTKEALYKALYSLEQLESQEAIKSEGSLRELMEGGGRGARSDDKYCMDPSACKSERVGEKCVVAGRLYLDNVQGVDGSGREFRGECGVINFEEGFRIVRGGGRIHSAEAEMFQPRDTPEPPADLRIYLDKLYGALKVSVQPREGFFRSGDETDLVRLELAFYETVAISLVALLWIATTRAPRAFRDRVEELARILAERSPEVREFIEELYRAISSGTQPP